MSDEQTKSDPWHRRVPRWVLRHGVGVSCCLVLISIASGVWRVRVEPRSSDTVATVRLDSDSSVAVAGSTLGSAQSSPAGDPLPNLYALGCTDYEAIEQGSSGGTSAKESIVFTVNQQVYCASVGKMIRAGNLQVTAAEANLRTSGSATELQELRIATNESVLEALVPSFSALLFGIGIGGLGSALVRRAETGDPQLRRQRASREG